MKMKIEQTHFNLTTGDRDERVISRDEFDGLMGAYVINDIAMTTRWVYTPTDGDGLTVITVDVRGRIQYLFQVTQPGG